MKKLLALVLGLSLLSGCAAGNGGTKDNKIEKLKVQFVPSRDVEDIVTVTAPLVDLLKEGLNEKGFEVADIEISVSSSYEAAGEALSAGTVDVAFIPGGTYVLYHEDGAELLLAATRAGLSKDFEDAKDWNDGKPTEGDSNNQVAYYRSLAIAGPSEIGKKLAEKVNSGQALTWEDVNEATWCHSSPTSSAGYVYPTIWLNDNFGKKISDLAKAVLVNGYTDSMTRLANGQCDVAVGYADMRRDYAEKWTGEWNRRASVWEETNVIAVTDGIMNDTISYSKNSEIMSEDFIKALQEVFIDVAKTEEGKKVIAIYSHEGYKVVSDSDYDSARKAQAIAQGK